MSEWRDQDLQMLIQLSAFLRQVFKGASFGDFKIDEAVAALDRLIARQGKVTG